MGKRIHPLFVSARTPSHASNADTPGAIATPLGLVDWPTGCLVGDWPGGGPAELEAPIPCRLREEAGLVRWWGIQLQREGYPVPEDPEEPLLTPNPPELPPSRHTVLTLRPQQVNEPQSTVNGMMYLAYADQELQAVERFYSHFKKAMIHRIPMDHFVATSSSRSLPPQELVGGMVHCVVCAHECFGLPGYACPIQQSYVDQVCAEFGGLGGDDFVAELLETTSGWSRFWLNDRGPATDVNRALDQQLRVYTSCLHGRRDESRYPELKPIDAVLYIFEAGPFMQRRAYDNFCEEYVGNLGDTGVPCRLKKEAGFRRSFCHRSSNGDEHFTLPALTVAENAEEARDICGVLYPAPAGWEQSSAESHRINDSHQRTELQPEQFSMYRTWQQVPQESRIIAYTCAGPEPPCVKYPISQERVDAVLIGCHEYLGLEFCQEFVDSTDGWNLPCGRSFWVNDRRMPLKPWVSLSARYKMFDRLLEESRSPLVPEYALRLRCSTEEHAAKKGADKLCAHTEPAASEA